ncbi:PD40 domain-containing protein [Virgibacillus doumboii]|uniref:PD40 domain-containing protein n=1 Tax=Virgibacillus doumboii TaxID=2697503 RepID=UPI0013E08C60|nr:PD40 domain-containing protein [Virgibacillus doumboii]
MTLKKKNSSFITGIVLLFFVLWGSSMFVEGSGGFTGFGQTTDLSGDDETLAFSYYHGDDASLYTVPVTGGTAEPLAVPEEGKSFINPKFSPDDQNVAFVKEWTEEEQRYGQLMIVDRKTGQITALTDSDGLVTDAAFSPDGQSLFFLKASVYKNYSSIASKRPHDYDVYHYNLKTGATEQITYKNAYHMSDLTVTPDGKQLMYRTYRNTDQIIFHSLEDGTTEKSMVPNGDFASNAPIISSPELSPDGNKIVFSDVATKDKNGTFIYEGFLMDRDTAQAEQITSFHEHVSSPVFLSNGKKLIVTVNTQFAQRNPEYHYWQISLEGDKRERVDIKIPEGK